MADETNHPTTLVYTIDDCLRQIVQYVETVGVESMSHLFIKDCLKRFMASQELEHLRRL